MWEWLSRDSRAAAKERRATLNRPFLRLDVCRRDLLAMVPGVIEEELLRVSDEELVRIADDVWVNVQKVIERELAKLAVDVITGTMAKKHKRLGA